MSEVAVKTLPARKDVRAGDTWDLASLFRSDKAWEEALEVWEERIPQFAPYAGTLGDSPDRLAECLAHDLAFDREGDRLGTYAQLRASEDTAAADAQRMTGRFQHVATRAGAAASFIRPEIMAIDPAKLSAWMALPALALGTWLGLQAYRVIPAEGFRLVLLGLLFLSGLSLVL